MIMLFYISVEPRSYLIEESNSASDIDRIHENFIDFMGVKNEIYDLSELIRLGYCGDVKYIASHCISKR